MHAADAAKAEQRLSAVTEAKSSASPLPAIVTRKVADFLAAGTTGQIILDVKDGRILAYKLTEAGRVPACATELASSNSRE